MDRIPNRSDQGQAVSQYHSWIRRIYYWLLVVIPFSMSYPWWNHAIELPSEPLMGLLFLLLLPLLWRTRSEQRKLWRSPLIVCSFAWLLWMGLGILWSSDPLVSAKYTLVTFCHWVLFMYGLAALGLPSSKPLRHWYNFYTLPLILILLYAWSVHARYGFSTDTSVLVARPFYFDHALLSVCLLLLAGIYAYGAFRNRSGGDAFLFRYYNLVILLLLLLGVYLSFSRAAWVSAVLASGIIGAIVLFKRSFRLMLGLSIGGMLVLLFLLPALFRGIADNRVESKKGNWWQQIVSVANVTTDVSNLERINRYSCAWRMFRDRPIRGFGVGTYEVSYLPYQRADETTRISVFTPGPHPPGRGGGAHSEYLEALSEMGLPGGLLFLGLLLASLWTGIRVYWKAADLDHRLLALGLLFGLLTFFIHGVFNNFLNNSKVAVLVWSSMAILVSLEGQLSLNPSGAGQTEDKL